MNILAAIGAFIVAWLVFNLFLPADGAAVIAAIIAVLVLFGFAGRSNL